MKHKGLENRNDDILTKEDVASLLELVESLNGTYTAWGRTFWSNGKPQDITSSPIFPNNGGLYIKDSDGEARLALYYSTDNIFYVGRGTSQRGSKTRLCGDSIELVPGTNPSDGVSVMTVAWDSVRLAAGKAFRVRNWMDTSNYDVLVMNSNNDLLIGQGVGANSLNTYIYGNTISLCQGGSGSRAALVINADMTVSIPKSLKIGNLVLSEGTGSNAGKLLINGSVIY